MNNNQNLNNNLVTENSNQEKNGTLWLLPIALILSGGIFKAINLLVTMVSESGGEVNGLATVIKVMDILPLIAWGLVVPTSIYAIIKTIKNKKK